MIDPTFVLCSVCGAKGSMVIEGEFMYCPHEGAELKSSHTVIPLGAETMVVDTSEHAEDLITLEEIAELVEDEDEEETD